MIFKVNTRSTKNQKLRNTISVLLAGCLMLTTLFSVLFLHVHFLPNGQIAVHSHALPHSSSGSSHTHTKLEYLVYFLTTVVNYFLIIIFLSRFRLKLLHILQKFRTNPFFFDFAFVQNPGRAPPIIFFL
ncbi:hypothetical protein Calab_0483 [Caldithrix abyssi DSM 13497]|uniref:Uncharacterized protein n=1 Tax=Caldithrix abyssi DSM 13497 TaxID=880073 RepID=H1XR34_CALAY|nr:hypothetical protein Calab_0483 [Caldithrix abyssi DSM 13497]